MRTSPPLVAIALTALAPLATGQVKYDLNFDDFELGKSWTLGEGAPDRAEIIAQGPDDHALRVFYPAGGVGPFETGLTFLGRVDQQGPLTQATGSYDVLFEEGFDFQRGGKLPGLTGGGTAATGGSPANGYNGWSARAMFNGNGELFQYVYHMNQAGTYGDVFYWTDAQGQRLAVTPGQSYQLKTQVQVNTPGQANGSIRSWLDGQLVLELDNMELTATTDLGIDTFYFSTFHGGNDDTWAPDNDSYIQFDNLLVTVPEPASALLLACLPLLSTRQRSTPNR